MNVDSMDAHPAFVNIIKQLSPDECRMLEYLRRDNRMPMLKIRQKVDEKNGEFDRSPFFSNIC